MMRIAHLRNRSLLRLGGADVVDFLQNLVTCDVEGLSEGEATFGALLTPQGKILFDFFPIREEEGFLLDIEASAREALAKRLTFYKLRADVAIDLVDDLKVFMAWDGVNGSGIQDPRVAELGRRNYVNELETNAELTDWEAHRIQLGVPQSGVDFDLGDAFPHEVLMDQFSEAGVDFEKGCYVGQEVVSRMHHRGTARSRWVQVKAADGNFPPQGTPVMAGDRSIGTMGSCADSEGLAILRLDRTKAAMDDNIDITSDGVSLIVRLPNFVNFGWPE